MLAGAACYKPNIKSGGLGCGAKNACPDGFQCDINHAPPVCVSGGPGGATGTGMGGQTGAGGGGGTGGVVCLPPMSGCTSTFVDGGACDPVCNVGCASCDQKCSVNTMHAMTCNPPTAPAASFMQMCIVTQPTGDVATQTDNCAPGQVCISPTTCGSVCYQFCRTNADCASKNCGRDIGNGLKVCDVAPSACDPTATLTVCDPISAQTRCYISVTNGRTLCDCGNMAQARMKDPCTTSRDCFPGLVCYNPTGIIGDSLCRRVCRLPTDGGAPDAGSTCQGDPSNCTPMLLTGNMMSTVWGYCNE